MDSARSIAMCTAGQPNAAAGNATFDFSMETKAEFAHAFAPDRSTLGGYRGAHHPPVPGEGRPA